jgi:hypothetical protein
VLARIIEQTSNADSLRVLAEKGIDTVADRTLARRLPGYAKTSFRAALAGACANHAGLGPASLVLYDLTTLYFGTTNLFPSRASSSGSEAERGGHANDTRQRWRTAGHPRRQPF